MSQACNKNFEGWKDGLTYSWAKAQINYTEGVIDQCGIVMPTKKRKAKGAVTSKEKQCPICGAPICKGCGGCAKVGCVCCKVCEKQPCVCPCCAMCHYPMGSCLCCKKCLKYPCHCHYCPECDQETCICKPGEPEAKRLWGIDHIATAREAADFYLLIHMTVQWPDDARPKYALDAKVEYLADQFSRYLDMAIGGELRHARGQCSASLIEKMDIPKTYNRGASWARWKKIREKRGLAALEDAYRIFCADGWRNSYGGSSWANVVIALMAYETGSWSPKMFVDQVFSIQHNGGCVFDKTWPVENVGIVLDAAVCEHVIRLKDFASHKVCELYASLRYTNRRGQDEQEI